jgi:hypothetical protein
MTDPKLSCIMVTRRDRLGLAMRAIHNLLGWNHHELDTPFRPYELVIVSDVDASEFGPVPDDVKVCNVFADGISLQGLFRLGMQESTGDWLTFIDDDVFYHSMRLNYQMQVALEEPDRPCVLADGMYFFFDSNELFVVSPSKFPARGFANQVIPYSAIFPRDHFIGFPDGKGHPMTNCMNFMGDKKIPITVIEDQWKWVCVGIRGDNLHGYGEFRKRVTNPLATRSVRWLQGMWPEVCGVVDAYSWEGDPTLCGHDGSWGSAEARTLWPKELPPIGTPADDIERVQEDLSNG